MADYFDLVTGTLLPSCEPTRVPADAVVIDNLAKAQTIDRLWRVYDNGSVRAAMGPEREARLEDYRAIKRVAGQEAVEDYAESRGYGPEVYSRLKHLRRDALEDWLVNRAGYIKQAVDWEATVMAHYGTLITAILSAQSVDDLDAVNLDFSGFDATDPGVEEMIAWGIPY